MRRKLHARLLAVAAAICAAGAGTAFAESMAAVAGQIQAAGGVVHYADNGAPRMIASGQPGGAFPLHSAPLTHTPEGFARAAVADYGLVFGIHDPARQLATKRIVKQGNGSSVHFQQMHNGIPVMGGEVVVNMRGNSITAVNGKSAPNLTVETTPTIEAAVARDTAKGLVAAIHEENLSNLSASEPELTVYVPSLIGPGNDKLGRLVWRVEVKSTIAKPIRELVLVDATTGSTPLHFNQVDTARQRYTYHSSYWTDAYTSATPVCDESSDTCAAGDSDEQAAHVYARDTYDFFSERFGRDGIDGAGMPIRSVAHFYDYSICPNAYWDGTQMTYCDGLPQGDDVVAHELTHGVTEHSSGLFYFYQSGAINESLSDVFGELVDQDNGYDPTKKWLIGDKVGSLFGMTALRSMKNPPAFKNPDKMTSTYYYKGGSDNGGVHTNSGVSNKAAYLMTDGGTFNLRTIKPIGLAKTAAIYYRANTNYLTSGSDYYDLYLALNQSCKDLIGQNLLPENVSITSADCTQVNNALLAVEMNKQPVAGFNPDAPLCPTGQPTNVVLVDGAEDLATWRQKGTIWSQMSGYAVEGNYALSGLTPASYPNDSSAYFANPVTVPNGGYLWFSQAYSFVYGQTQAGAIYYFDGGVLEYSADAIDWTAVPTTAIEAGALYKGTISKLGTNQLSGRKAWVGNSHGYVSTRVNLKAFAGSTLYFRWRLGSSAYFWPYGYSVQSEWIIDDVRVYSCSAVDTVAPKVSATSPANLATGVKRNAVITAKFSENVNCATVNDKTFSLANAGVPVAGTVACSNNTATFTPSVDLLVSKKYTATVTSAVKDVAGNAMAANKVWSFTTGTLSDTTAPKVTLVSPANNTSVATNVITLKATFSENVDCATVNAGSFTVDSDGTLEYGNITCSGTVVTLGPVVLKNSALNTATLTTAITDLAGNPLAAPKVWSFSTPPGMLLTDGGATAATGGSADAGSSSSGGGSIGWLSLLIGGALVGRRRLK